MQAHHQKTIADLEELIGKLTTTRETLVTAFADGDPVAVSVRVLAEASRNGGPTDALAGYPKPAAAQVAPPPASSKPKRPLRRSATGRGHEHGIGAAVREVLPQFGQSWFSVEAVKEAIQAKYPGKFAEGKLKDVSVRLIGGVNRWLESQGTGRDRRYRNLPAALTAGETYEQRKAQLLG